MKLYRSKKTCCIAFCGKEAKWAIHGRYTQICDEHRSWFDSQRCNRSQIMYAEDFFNELALAIGDPKITQDVEALIRPFLDYETFS